MNFFLVSIDVVSYSDVDFKGCVDNKKSTTKSIFFMARGVVSWQSAKQFVATSSTMEAEYVACYEATSCSLASKFYS